MVYFKGVEYSLCYNVELSKLGLWMLWISIGYCECSAYRAVTARFTPFKMILQDKVVSRAKLQSVVPLPDVSLLFYSSLYVNCLQLPACTLRYIQFYFCRRRGDFYLNKESLVTSPPFYKCLWDLRCEIRANDHGVMRWHLIYAPASESCPQRTTDLDKETTYGRHLLSQSLIHKTTVVASTDSKLYERKYLPNKADASCIFRLT